MTLHVDPTMHPSPVADVLPGHPRPGEADTASASGTVASVLPQPHTLRWQPLRLGLVDLFYYENEIFPFRDGRLLLRGNNGAGKSKVLALALPFLLDGDLSARRVEPDADPNKRMEWNLLLGGEHPNSERLGYSWLEFGRRDENGDAHFLTIGAGLKAARGRGITRHWFFTSTERVDERLSLVDRNRVVLGRDRLQAELGDHGRVYDTKTDYRRAIDEKLFGLGERRYTALIDLLVQIRAPQLSKRPSERLLSDALTESLTPVGDDVIKSVADGLRSLDEERDELQQLTDAHRSVLAFLDHYRAYARVLLKRQAEGPRTQQAEHDRLGRTIIALTTQTAQAEAEAADATARLDALRGQQTDREAEREALRDSEFIEVEKQLAAADHAATTAAERMERAAAEQRLAMRQLASAERRAVEERRRVAETRDRYDRALSDVVTAAADAGVGHEHDRVVQPPSDYGTMSGDADAAPGDAETMTAPDEEHERLVAAGQERLVADRAATRTRIERARDALERVQQLLDALTAAESSLAAARHGEDAAETRLAEAIAARTTADEAVEEATERHISDVEVALAKLTELAVPDDDFTAFTQWVRDRDGENPVAVSLRAAGARAASELHGRLAMLRQLRGELDARHAVLRAEIAALEGGEIVEPPAAHTRVEVAGGLPLWRAVSFRDQVTETERAGIEAALEASGLLTAVVLADGDVRDPKSGEVILRAGVGESGDAPRARAEAGSGTTLRDVLRVEPPADSGVSDDTIDAVLGSIVFVDGVFIDGVFIDGVRAAAPAASADEATGAAETVTVWVSATGRFRLGAAYGAWSKDAARYIGESAQAAARQRRLGEARAELDELAAQLETSRAELTEIGRRLDVVGAEQVALPHPRALEDADRAAALATDRAASAARDRNEASATVSVESANRDTRAAELAEDAAVLGLPADAGMIRERRVALAEYERLTTGFWHSIERMLDSVRVLGDAESLLVDSRSARERADAECAVADEDARGRRSYADTLRASVGVDVARFRAQVAAVETALRDLKRDLKTEEETRVSVVTRLAAVNERLRGIREQHERVAADRVAAVEVLRKTADLGLARVALAGIQPSGGQQSGFEQPATGDEWTVTRGVQFARAVEQALTDVDASDARYDRLLSQVHTEFTALQRSLSRHGHEAASYPREEGYQVLVTFMGREVQLIDLADILHGQLAERERLLSAREREIIQNHLVTEVGAQLSELIGDADRQIAELNNELHARPTSTGMILRVRWKPRADGPSTLADARRILATTSDVWDDSDRSSLGEFLQARIADVRDADESGNWYDHLGEALDYRRWHHFAVERQQAGVWKPASGPASGGERVLAASIPLFAAASSHYRTAGNPHAPRLVMLDEAFAGVDDNARASCLGLLASFDLDVVMTSEREWGCYAEVPGLSIAQLTRFDDTPAVHVQLWQWDGRQRTVVDEPPDETDSLW